MTNVDRRRLLLAAAASAVVAACGSPGSANPTPTKSSSTITPAGPAAAKATVELTKGGSFSFRLRPDKAPQTVARFAQKAKSGFYQGLTFHRVEDWVVQGGDPTGSGGGGNQVPSEYNDLPFVVGAVGIARSNNPAQMNDSQFFIVKTAAPHLDKQYANFGLVTAGMDVVNAIRIGDRIKSVTIE
ncbi:MAG: peptidylprolyl isomerase [Chloroflexota bacterium]|nr:peptidylprolyl isomerase [Chloroflexota bacterium]